MVPSMSELNSRRNASVTEDVKGNDEGAANGSGNENAMATAKNDS